jgi:hypothetical protein
MADDQQFSAQDLADLQDIRGQMPANHPLAGKLDAFLASQGGAMPNKGLASPAQSGINPGELPSGMQERTLTESAGPALAAGEVLKGQLHKAADTSDLPAAFRPNATLGQAEAAAMPMSRSAEFALPPIAATRAVQAVKAIPTPEEVGKTFGAIEDAARASGQTVQPSVGTMNAFNRAKEINAAAKTPLPAPMRGFGQNVIQSPTNPSAISPLTFQQARDIYVPSTRLTAQESSRLTGPMKGMNQVFARSLDSDIRGAAQAMGQGETYAQAMRDYPLAVRVQGLKDALPGVMTKVAKYGLAALGTGALGGLGFEIARELKK